MAHFVVQAMDAEGKAAARAENRPAHRARLREHDFPLVVRIAGPILDDAGEMCGTTLIIEADDKETVSNFVKGDPYAQAGVYADVSIHSFAWGLTQLKDM